MTTRYDEVIKMMHDIYYQLNNVLNAAATAKVITADLLAHPDYAAALTTPEEKYVAALDTALGAVPTDLAIITYTLTVSAGANGTVSPTGSVVVNYLTGQLLTATPDSLYEVNEWKVDSVLAQTGGDTFMFDPVYADAAIAVSFKLI